MATGGSSLGRNMATQNIIFWIFFVIVGIVFRVADAEILIPPYFNLAEGRHITATATCGEDEPELYCKLVGANAENDANINIIQGQVCDFCDANNPTKRHPPEYAVDGMETWWQSPPLSRGMKYNEVNLTIDLGQEFHVAYVFVRMGNSPRPGLWALEKSSDYGKTYVTWQYFSDSASDCETYFGKESLLPITRDDSVICNTEYSKIVPLEGGEIPISLLNNRPSANAYFNSSVLQEWTRATNVRLRLLRTKTLYGHLMSVARQDNTVTRRYFYSIKDVSIGGRCMCNGHAETCDIPDPHDPNKLQCRCQHHTCGPQCAYCCPGFQQKAWRQSQVWQRFVCEPCNCHNHSTECSYDPDIDAQGLSLDIHGKLEGGGVCKNCQHNTEGINCNKCIPTFYRPEGKYWNQTDVCQPCDCSYRNSTGNCAEGTGQCECRKEFQPPLCDSCSYGYYDYPDCKPCICNQNGTQDGYCEPYQDRCPCIYNYAGMYCEQCSDGYYSFPTCKECSCNSIGSLTSACDQESGNCTCKSSFSGRTCEQCAHGYYNYPNCLYCNCDTSGTVESICNDTTGTCMCKEGFGGERCDQCIPGYYSILRGRERVCVACNCSSIGSTTNSCDANGKCTCLYNFGGKQCDQCSPGYYNYTECLPCNCDAIGAIGETCDSRGQCQCKRNFDVPLCNSCKEGFYNYPTCEECNCDPAGVIDSFAGCGSLPDGELCQCKERVQGRICDECKPLYWDLQQYNPQGCIDCECHISGTQNSIGVCDTKTGQCTCKYSVDDKNCGQCKDGSYNLSEGNIFGCVDCGCDVGGSVSKVCNKQSGQCTCKPRITGLRCNEPISTHYFPTLHQYQYEAEDATTPSGNPVRYNYSQEDFPNFSWKGYAVFLPSLQNQIVQDVQIYKSSVYRMVMHYVNPNPDPIIGKITISPENTNEIEQSFNVLLKPTTSPQFVTVSGAQGTTTSPFVMNPGNWLVTFKADKKYYLDYFTFIPAAYYEATILSHNIESVCVVGDNGLCRHFAYPNISWFDTVKGAGGFAPRNGVRSPITEYITNKEQLKNLQDTEIPLLIEEQNELLLDLIVTKTGPHVMLLEYVTPPELQNSHPYAITVTVRGNLATEMSKVTLDNCPYTFACRRILTDQSHRVHVFNIQDNFVGLTLKGEPGANVGIKSIVVIPYNQWHLDYIKPQSVCVFKNGTCLQAEFPPAPDSKKIEFEAGLDVATKTRPRNIFDNTTQLIYLKSEDVDINSKVQFPGHYVFIVQYYQPDHPESELKVLIQNGQIYEATLPIKHCPSNSGCRSVIQMQDGNNLFSLTENFLITLTENKGKGVWLDYLMVTPAVSYKDSILTENRLDQTKEFITKCGNNHFYVNTTQEGFCRDAVFSLTSDFNNGASPCYCDYRGSHSFECNPFGGQCDCKPNVIGRKCDECQTGFYGFPNCKKCDCPSTAVCEKVTGECQCPTRVMGEKCDQCEPNTYGFDHLIGCEACNCNENGVENYQMQCNLLNGSCNCRPNVVGRTCDECSPGHYSFPRCEACECDTKGTLPDICDPNTAKCYCKENVNGNYCELCKDGSFDLQNDNELGCTKCFCFGKTTRCDSADLYWYQISSMEDWGLVNIDIDQNITIFQHNNPPQMENETVIGVELTNDDSMQSVVYFSAPSEYLENKLASYGGKLEYSIFYTTGPFGSAVGQGDVIIEGGDMYLIHTDIEQPPASTHWVKQLIIRESEFTTLTGLPATRERLMTALKNLKGLYIRATYWKSSVITRLQDVKLDYGVESNSLLNGNMSQATSVEQCQCTVNYQGRSCEECADGFYRVQSGPHGGYCMPCQCNGHASTCDVNTGICFNCQHNTEGDHCERCIEGYNGNALYGTPQDCLICACPLPVDSNNFATSCEVSPDGRNIACQCKEGYYGPRCESCDSGYYGQPEILNETCKPCNCSGNINTEDRESCDTVSGDCLKCLNNTAGAACAFCEPGFFGDAIILKDCQACLCADKGMDHCDSYTGRCVCREGVEGDKCDRCMDQHWGFESGQGCTPCNCSEASHSRRCDDTSGQCQCKVGVTGSQCDRCASGFWNFSNTGCITCGCNTEYSEGFGCNAKTGHCECLSGVTGEKCDRCPYRWVFVKKSGCLECNSCIHNLLDSTDQLNHLITPVMNDFQNKASGFFTAQRLVYIQNQALDFAPSIKSLDPHQFDLTILNSKIDSLENDTRYLDRKANYSMADGLKLKGLASELVKQCTDVLEEVELGAIKSYSTVDNVLRLANSLETAELPRIDSAVVEAKQILSDIKAKDLSPQTNNSAAMLDNAKKLLEKMEAFLEPVEDQNKAFQKLASKISKFDENLDEIIKYANTANEKVDQAKKLTEKNRIDQKNSDDKIAIVNSEKKESDMDLNMAREYLLNASYALEEASKFVESAGRELNEGFHINDQVNKTLMERDSQLKELNDTITQAIEHERVLQYKADRLNKLYETTKNNSQTEHAVRGASAYPDIVKEITAAREASKAAADAITNATALTGGLNDRVAMSKADSTNLHQDALNLLQNVQANTQKQLQDAVDAVNNVSETNRKSDDNINAVVLALKSIPVSSLNPFIDDAKKDSQKVNETVQEVKEIMNDLSQILPPSSKLQAEQLPKDIDDIIKSKGLIKKELSQALDNSPLLANKTLVVQEKKDELENLMKAANKNMEKLRKAIAVAKEVANRIKVGMNFDMQTNVELKPPPNVEELGTSMHVSAYFKTENEDGILMYLGNLNGTKLPKTKTDDFMALEIKHGHPTLTIDIGDGPIEIVSNKTVSDGVWYQVIVDRVGKNVDLKILKEDKDGKHEYVTKGTLPGTHSIFNLDKDNSKLFVGGYPTSNKVQDGVHYSSFEGEIEEVMIGDTPIGLWNFENATVGHIKGARERDSLINQQLSNTYKFNGEGYVIIDTKSYNMREYTSIDLNFKTFANDGLLFLVVGIESSFLSIEMRGGKIFVQFRLNPAQNSPVLTLGTIETYNDGKWHRLVATRSKKAGELRIDEVIKNTNNATGYHEILNVTSNMYFGGYPSKHNYIEVTNQGFDGCIENVHVTGEPLDLNQNLQAFGLIPGCPAKFDNLVSFDKDVPNSFIKGPNVSSSNKFELSVRFKTSAKDGLIFYAPNRDQSSVISLSMVNGILNVISKKEKITTGTTAYNDDQWHIVTVTHNDMTLKIVIDDYDIYGSDSPPPQLHLMQESLYIGGVPSDYVITPSGTASRKSFAGCLADVTVNNVVVNFVNATEKYGEALGKCSKRAKIGGFDASKTQVPIISERIGVVDEIKPPHSTPGFRRPVKPKPPVQVPVVDKVKDIEMTTPHVVSKWKEDEKLSKSVSKSGLEATDKDDKTAKVGTPPPQPKCSGYDFSKGYGDFNEGYRFGAKSDSRIEFEKLPARYKNSFDFSVDFNTTSDGGLIFYADDANHKDFVALYMKDGKIHFAFNCGSGPLRLVSTKEYNDGIWHNVVFSRDQQAGKLIVDEEVVAEGTSPASSNSIIMQPPFFFGGLANATTEIKYNLLDYYSSFNGCLRNLEMSGRPVVDIKQKVGTYSCSQNMEEGYFFGGHGGYIKLFQQFKVAVELELSMEVKARTAKGLLLSVHGRVDYLIVEIVNNTILAKVNSQRGPFTAQYILGDQNILCDGNWHSIQVLKSRNVISIGVNGSFGNPGIGGEASTNTKSALFIGGHSSGLKTLKGSTARQGFTGCIRNISIRGRQHKSSNVKVLPTNAFGDAHVGLCPVD